MKRIFCSDEPNTFHYLTFVVFNRISVFLDDELCQILADVIDEIRELHPFKLVGYVFMPDHAHLLINPLKPEIEVIKRKLKGKSAKLILDHLVKRKRNMTLKNLEIRLKGRRHAVWQRRAADVDVVSGRFFRQKLNYIHMNPVRAGLCNDPIEWKWSSFRAYLPRYADEVPLKVDWPSHWTKEEIEGSRN